MNQEFQTVTGYTYEKGEEIAEVKTRPAGFVRTVVKVPAAAFKAVTWTLGKLNPLNLLRGSARRQRENEED
jgi:hypothetical protein